MNEQTNKWSLDDENTLIELVEKYEYKGKSKQEAFEMVANIINRSKAACSSRYQLLKKKQNSQYQTNHSIEVNQETDQNKSPSLELIIQFLSKEFNTLILIEENNQLQNKLLNLKAENEKLIKTINHKKADIQKKYVLLKPFVNK
ncbi:Myb-like DNA-binding domain-containing protein [Bacillus sp. EAC]|uniref:Myb-like DNA-binding domain-containing protein n=1 Tax=Bacillus sp. EAC TaxID=1978338 RepID=UPI000B442BD1|nr:Myb-like DNA-binding domain-containing protein [Bacillus sp. EAC]